jgi:hypothetical protein
MDDRTISPIGNSFAQMRQKGSQDAMFSPVSDPSYVQYDPDVKVFKLADIIGSDAELRKKKRNRRLARQASTVERAVVLKATPVLATAARSLSERGLLHGTPSALSSSLAKVDLVDTVAAVEARKNAKPMRTDISLQAKRRDKVAPAAATAPAAPRGKKKSASSTLVAPRRTRSHPAGT